MRTVQLLDRLIKYGLLLLLIWTPLAFGAVHAWAYSLLQIHVFILVALWLGRDLVARYQLDAQNPDPFVCTSLALPLALFILLLLVQVLPFPAPILQWISPTAANLYQQFLPNWPSTLATLSLQPYLTQMAVGQWLAFAGIFLMAVNVLRTHEQIRLVCWTIVGIACFISLIAITQKMLATSEIYWSRDASYTGGSFFGPFVNKNHFAGYQNLALFVGLGLLLSQPSFRTEIQTNSAWRKRLYAIMTRVSPVRLLLVFILAMMSGALFLSGSRGGIASFVVGLVSLSCFLRRDQIKLKHKGLIATVLVMTIGMGVWLGILPMMRSVESIVSDETVHSLAGRLPIFQTAWAISEDFPFLGIGYGTFSVISARYQPALDYSINSFAHVHNDFLQLLVETGWVGFSILMTGVLLVLREIIRKWLSRHDPFVKFMVAAGLSAIVAMSAHSLVDFNLHIPSNALLFTIVMAVTYAAANVTRRMAYSPETAGDGNDMEDAPVPRRLYRVLLSTVGIIGAIVLASMTSKIAVADLLYPQQTVLRPTHWVYTTDPSIRRSRLIQALEWTPHNPYYWRSLASLDVQAARAEFDVGTVDSESEAIALLRGAVDNYQRALLQEPTVPDAQLGWLQAIELLGNVSSLSSLPDVNESSAWYTKIASLAPSSPSVQYNLGVILLSRSEAMTMQPRPFFRRTIELSSLITGHYVNEVLRAYRHFLPDDEAFLRFASSVPNTIHGHLHAARLLEGPHWTQARLHYRIALYLSESDPGMLKSYGEALHRHHSFPDAEGIWERLIELTPDDAGVYLKLAAAQIKLNVPERAAQTLEQLVARFPQDPKYLTTLAEHYMQQQLLGQAEGIWKRTIDLEPHSAQGYSRLAKVYTLREEFGNAVRVMQRAVSLASSQASHHYQLASLFQQIGKPEKAEQVYQRLTRNYNTAPHSFYMLGQLAEEDGHLSLAASYYRRAATLQPQQGSYQQAMKSVNSRLTQN